ncbi:MAG TPA: hypothetical protein PKH79_15090 [Prolixibacteraceae bacterium]|nr:hypothetical protein [Prolixibacteraceae bacterium]
MNKLFYSILPLLLLFTFQKGFCQTTESKGAQNLDRFTSMEIPSHILVGEGITNMGHLLYEANIAPTFKMSPQQLPDLGFVFIPQIDIRMYNQFSHPIRTPSYMPRGIAYYHFNKSGNDQFVFLTLGHHSNGQDGSLYESDSVTINTRDGSFSTNYLSVSYEIFTDNTNHFRPFDGLRLSAALHSIKDVNVRYMYGRLRFNADLKSTYQFKHQIRNIITNTKQSPQITSMLRLGWIGLDMDHANAFDIDRLILNYTLSFQPAIISDLEIFVRYYYGQDYYNINFERKLNALQFGFSLKNISFR